MLALKPLQGSKMETRKLLGGTEENSVSPTRGQWFAFQANQWFFSWINERNRKKLNSGQDSLWFCTSCFCLSACYGLSETGWSAFSYVGADHATRQPRPSSPELVHKHDHLQLSQLQIQGRVRKSLPGPQKQKLNKLLEPNSRVDHFDSCSELPNK